MNENYFNLISKDRLVPRQALLIQSFIGFYYFLLISFCYWKITTIHKSDLKIYPFIKL